LGIGDWGLGPIPNPQSPIPNVIFLIYISLINIRNGDWGLGIGDWANPQSPIPNPHLN